MTAEPPQQLAVKTMMGVKADSNRQSITSLHKQLIRRAAWTLAGLSWRPHNQEELFEVSRDYAWCVQTKVTRVRPWFTCHTFSSSYSSSASWNWAGVKPRDTQRCSASAMRTTPPAPPRPATPSVASSRSREKITSAGRWALEQTRGRDGQTGWNQGISIIK